MTHKETIITLTSKYDFNETVDRLKHAIKTAELLLIHEINTQQIMERHGITIKGFKQLLYFHPVYMKQVLDTHPEATIHAPLKFVIREVQNGSVDVFYIDPTTLFASYPGLEEFGATLERIVVTISMAITS